MGKMFRQPLRILHVEDDLDTREITSIALKWAGPVTLMQCESGKEAIEKAVEFRPDVVLLDVMMPTMDGPELLSRLKQIPELRDVPVIFITVRAQKSEIAELMSLGALAVIIKPFESLELLDTIEAVMTCRFGYRER
jgi:CheY-like chemotaxis protein